MNGRDKNVFKKYFTVVPRYTGTEKSSRTAKIAFRKRKTLDFLPFREII